MSNTSLLGSYGDNSGAGLMFRNRLINASSFDIWQRGTSFSSLTTYTYTADRWLTDGAVTTVARTGTQNNVMQVVTQAGTGIAQRVETNGGNFLAGQTYTLSGSINASIADLTITVTYRAGNTFKATIHTATVSSQLTAGTYSKFTTTFTLANAPTDFAGTDCIQVSLTSSVVNTLNIASVQLEAGPVATPFERRPIGMELALCQRYYQRGLQNRGAFPAYSITGVSFRIPLITTMRVASPGTQISGTSLTNCLDKVGTASYTPTSISFLSAVSTDAVHVDFGGTFTQYQPLSIITDIIQVNAEL